MVLRSRLSIPLLAAVGNCAGVSVLLATVFNYFVVPMSEELHLSTRQISAALGCHLIALVVGLPIIGSLVDRVGTVWVIRTSAALMAMCYFVLSQVPGNPLFLYLGFALTGLLGSGTSAAIYAKVIVMRFDRFRGVALGVAMAGIGIASILLPFTVGRIVGAHGWRDGFLAAGVAALIAGFVGSLSAGGKPNATTTGVGALSGVLNERQAQGLTVRSTLQSSLFWILAAALFVYNAAVVGVVAHLSEAWRSFGWSTDRVPIFQAMIGAGVIAGRIIGGIALDHFKAHQVGAVASLTGAAALLIVLLSDGALFTMLAAGALLGFCTGAESDVASVLCSRRFGTRNFGQIYGYQSCFLIAGSAVGPYVAATIAEAVDFRNAFLVAAGLLLTSAGLFALLRTPPKAAAASLPT